VVAVGGEITLTGSATPTNSNFQNMAIQFASIEAVAIPEPSSTLLLGLGSLFLMRRRR